MRNFSFYCGTILMLQVFCAVPHDATTAWASAIAQTQDVSLLQPTDTAYDDATEFERFLKAQGLTVRSVHRSHLEGFFQGIEKAAFFRTDKGVVEVAFFPGPHDAEKLRVTYSKGQSAVVPHQYRIEGQPTNPDGVIQAAYPVYFTFHRSWYIVTSEAELDAILKRGLGQDRRAGRQRGCP
jgi:hypothetical protein